MVRTRCQALRSLFSSRRPKPKQLLANLPRTWLNLEYLEVRLAPAVWSGDIYDGLGGKNGPLFTNDEVQQIVGNVHVPAGKTLTVQPGTVVKFNGGFNLLVDGILNATGTAGQSIVVTSYRDDSAGGDTNQNGASSGSNGDWGAITFAVGTNASVMNRFEVRYGGYSGGTLSGQVIANAAVTLSNGVIRNSYGAGVRINASNPTLSSISITDSLNAAISMDLAAHPIITSPTVSANGLNGVSVDGGTLNANNAWDNPGIVYGLTAPITVASGVTLNVAAGQVVKLYPNINLSVNGSLNVSGTAGQPVKFTSYRDDSAGGDTNNNGATVGNNGDWGAIQLNAGGGPNVLSNVDIAFGGYSSGSLAGQLIVAAPLTMAGSTVRNSYNGGVRIIGASPTLTAGTFKDNAGPALSADLTAHPLITSPVMTNNGFNALVLDSGSLTVNMAWDNPDIVYMLLGEVTVPAAITLTVAAGQVVKLAGNVNLQVSGTLVVAGSTAKPVYFTSYRDDLIGGDTNNNGPTTGANGDWGCLQFFAGGGASSLDHAQIRFGGYSGGTLAGELIAKTNISVSNSSILNAYGSGVRLENSASVFSNVTWANNSNSAMTMDLASHPVVTNPTLTNNGVNGLSLDAGTLPTSNTWNNPDIVYFLTGSITVPAATTLELTAGQIVKLVGNANLLVDGSIRAAGTVGQPIVFTSYRDDSVGGDTNNNGQSGGVASDWGCIQLTASAGLSVLDHVELRFGGYSGGTLAAQLIAASPLTLTNAVVRNSYWGGVRLNANAAVLQTVAFLDNAGPALSMDLAAQPVISNPSFANNGLNGAALDAGTLPASASWNNPEVVYQPAGAIVVQSGKVLTIGAGQVIKMPGNANLTVNGTLLAAGTAFRPITFTSYRDDQIGGDTNNNGESIGLASDWGAIQIAASSVGSVLDHLVIAYGGYSGGTLPGALEILAAASLSNSVVRNSYATGLRIAGASPTITNTAFLSNAGAPITMDLASNPQFVSPMFASNGRSGLVVDAGTLPASLTLDSPDVLYTFGGGVTIPAGMTLTFGSSATLDLVAGADIGGPGTLINLGVFRRILDANTTVVSAPFVNRGSVAVEKGILRFTNSVSVNDGGILSGHAPGAITLLGNLQGTTLNANQFAPGGAVIFGGAGTQANPQLFEAMGQDKGAVATGFSNNFVYYDLELANGTYVKVVDQADNTSVNGTEAVYVNNLVVPAGTTLDLNGLKIYARYSRVAGTVVGGSVSLLPDGGPLARDLSTPGAISVAGQIDDWTLVGIAGQFLSVTVSTGSTGSPAPFSPALGFAQVQLIDPSGNVIADSSNAQAGADAVLGGIALPANGIYHIKVKAPGAQSNSTGNYVITAFDATPQIRPLALNQKLTGNIENPARIDRWTFTGQPGQVVQFDFLNAASSSIVFDLTGPGGFTAFSGVNVSSGSIALPTAGAYALTVHANGRPGGAYAFRLDQENVTSLSLGSTFNGTIGGSGQSQLFQVTLAQAGQLLINLDDASSVDHNEVYVSLGSVPTRSQHQYRFSTPASADQQVVVPSAPPGIYYILVFSKSVPNPGTFKLLAQSASVFVTEVTPASLGNGESMTLTVSGAGFDPQAVLSLVSSGGTVFQAISTNVDLPTQITATFGAGVIPADVYSVRVTQANGATATLANAFTSVQGGQSQLRVELVVPSSMGYHIPGVIFVDYSNQGTVAMPAPLLLFQPTQTHADGTTDAKAFLTLDQSLVTAGFWTTARPAGFSNSVQILASGATPGLLQPGESVRVPVYYAGWQQPWDLSYPDFNYQVIALKADDPAPVNWASMKDDLRPAGIDDGSWDVVYSNLVSMTGSTVGAYVRSLDQAAAYLGQLGRQVTDIGRLLAFQIAQAEGLRLIPQLGSTIDAAAPAPGMGIVFSRTFNAGISDRSLLGPLGRGWVWTGPWQTGLTVGADGTVVLGGAGAHQRVFQPDSRGGYLKRAGDQGELVSQAGGKFILREQDGSVEAFRADGRIDYVEEANHNRITATYTGNLLTKLTHSSGQTMTLAYNAAGRISSVTDSAGRVTTYTYDAANEHLLTVTGFDGRVLTYTYSTTDGPAKRHALLSITSPDGVRRHFGYDANGRLNDAALDGGVNHATLTYGPNGAVKSTDATGAVTTYYFDDRGLVLKIDDPLHRDVFYKYDNALRMTEAIDAAGQTYNYRYNSRGQLIQSTDPLGQTRSFAYSGPFNRLSSVTDARGNATRYGYDSRGNVTSTTYADGTVGRAEFDPVGNAINATNARGQAVSYSYNAAGRLLSKVFADGSRVDLTYDARGNLKTITDPDGTTTLTYDVADRAVQINYPGGKFLKYAYDAAGRRSKMEDQTGFVTNYAYDAAGRLATLKDGSGNLLASYAYDATGYLQSIQNGNGSSTTYEHDLAGQLTHVINRDGDNQVVSRFDYTYNVLGLATKITMLEGVWNYTYDAIGQLIHAVFQSNDPSQYPNQDLAYQYDAAGNRTSTVINGTTTAYVTNSMNQYTSVGTASFAYDADGNRIRKTESGVSTIYAYDVENNLVGIDAPGESWSLDYDALGNLSSTVHNGVLTSFVTDPAGLGQIVSSYDAANALVKRFLFGGNLVGSTDGAGALTYYQFDARGNTVGLTNAAGDIVDSFASLPFGEEVHATNSSITDFKFGGAFGVLELSDGLTSMRARTYDAELGRFLQADPIGTAGGMNLYRYANNNPISNVDPSGLALDPATWATITGLFNAAAELGLTAQADVIFKSSIQAVAAAEAEYLGAAEVNVPRLIAGLRGLIARNVVSTVTTGGSALVPAVTVTAPGVTVVTPAVTVAAPGVTVAAPGAGIATEVVIGTEVAEVAAVEGIGASGFLAGGSLVIASGIGGAIVGTIINEAVLSNDTKEIIGDTLLGIWEQTGRLIEYLGGKKPDYSRNVASRDPNQKIGPAGFGSAGFIRNDGQAFAYRIDFENDKSATAPAQRVTITDQLSNLLDWNSLAFTEIGFGDTLISIPGKPQHYQTSVELTQNGKTFNVEIELDLDPITGMLVAVFQSLDPNTELPPDVLTGFLPPENGTGRGMGHIGYLVEPKKNLPTGTQIRNIALIRFDSNELIATDQVDPHDASKGVDLAKQALITIDAGGPASTVASLPATSPLTFTVNWSGSDDASGSGIASYDIYVSDNGGAFTPWLTGKTSTSASFTGVSGHTYGFYSVATDNVGNRQSTPGAAQATTQSLGDVVAPSSTVASLPATSPTSFTVTWSGSDNAGGSGLANYDIFVSDNGAAYTALLTATTQTSTTFNGTNGHTYRFYSVAVDNAGNRQATPANAQATTLVSSDTIAPTSTVKALPKFSAPAIALSWSGTDNAGGSGVAKFDIFVSDNSGAFTAFLTGTTLTSTTYSGVSGHSYRFYSVAIDQAGNRQATPAAAQADTQALLDTPNKRYVDAVYLDVLGREVDVTGLQFWSNELDKGEARATLIDLIDHSAEYFSTIIKPAYQTFLGRQPDASGLAYWVDAMTRGLTDEQLEAGFIGSPEYYQFAGGTDMAWVDAMYQNLLGRSPDASGRSFWVQQLASGASRSGVAYGFAASAEREGQHVQGAYEKYLGRKAGQSEIDYWVDQFVNHGKTNEDVITGFVSSDEYYQKHSK